MSEDMTPSKDEMISSLRDCLKAQSLMTDTLKETIRAQAGIIKHYAERIEEINSELVASKRECDTISGYWLEERYKKTEIPKDIFDVLEKIGGAKNMTARSLSEYAQAALAKARGENPETGK